MDERATLKPLKFPFLSFFLSFLFISFYETLTQTMFDVTLIRDVFLAISNRLTELQATFAAISMRSKQGNCDKHNSHL